MNKIDARKLSPDALKALRGQAMRMRQELALPWREIARVMGLVQAGSGPSNPRSEGLLMLRSCLPA